MLGQTSGVGTEKRRVGEHRTQQKREDTQKLACPMGLGCAGPAKNFGAWVGFLRTVGEQRRGAMGTAPVGSPGLRILAEPVFRIAEEQVKNGLYCTFSFLGNMAAPQRVS